MMRMFHPSGPTLFELAVQALSSTERGYDLLAPKFEHTPFRTSDAILNAVARHIGGPASIESALDLCSGTGAAMRMLRPLCRERVVGLDVSQGMLRVGQRCIAGATGNAALYFVRGDALDLPFPVEFDLVVCFGALGHILHKDQPRFIEQIAQVLKLGGRFVTITSCLPSMGSTQYWISRIFNGAMHLRNLLFSPPFIMYYLRFLLPEARQLLEAQGFKVEVREGLLEGQFKDLRLVIATLSRRRGNSKS